MMFRRRRAAWRAQILAEAAAQQQAERDAAFQRNLEQAKVLHWRGPARPAYLQGLAAPDVRSRR